jgi:hypothetical protein
MKVKLWVEAFSNISYRREDVVDCDYTKEEWEQLPQRDKWEYLDEMARDFVWEDIECSAEVIDEDG